MKLPKLRYADGIGKSTQIQFGGLNHNYGAADGEIWDMKNMTSDHYPVLATRERRRLFMKLTEPGGIYAWDKLCWIDGGKFFYDGEEKGTLSAGEKRFASVGSKIVIFPDKCYYDIKTDTFGQMEAIWESEHLFFDNGMLYGEKAEANTIYCEGVNWSDWFRNGDAVTISGCTKHPENNKTAIIRQIDGAKMYFYEFAFTLDEDKRYQETGAIRVARTVPDLKYICENENRLWGCTDSTIYASKRDDIFNWNVYDGLESDAWAVEPAAAGKLTGAVSYKGYAVFSKEERIYKVYGSTASSFGAVASASLGVADGSGDSLAIAGETLFYLSESGIMAYSGGIPQPISQAFGRGYFRNAAAGSDGLKYYVSMQDADGVWRLYVFDTQKGLWHIEDETHVTHFARCDGQLYMLNEEGEVWVMGKPEHIAEEVEKESELPWYVEFSDFTGNSPNKKGISKLQLRLELEEDAEAEVQIMLDGDGLWQTVRRIVSEGTKRSYTLPIIPRRCDYFRLRVEGTGGCRIYSMSYEMYAGSDVRSKQGRN